MVLLYYLATILAPKGKSASFASLKCCRPKGIPIIVQHKIRPKTACVIASSTPPKISQRIFKISEVVFPLTSTSLPKGKKLSTPSLKHCKPTGTPIIVMHHKMPKKNQIKPAKMPPNKNQIMLPIILISSPAF